MEGEEHILWDCFEVPSISYLIKGSGEEEGDNMQYSCTDFLQQKFLPFGQWRSKQYSYKKKYRIFVFFIFVSE
jgi:hypothetical protein